MTSNLWKRLLCLVLVAAMLASLSVSAFASEGVRSDTTDPFSAVQSILTKYVLSHKNALTKAIVRSQFKAAASAGAAVGCTTAAMLLNHSLRNHPADVVCGESSRYAAQILRSAECREIVQNFESAAKNAGGTEYTMKGAVALRSTPDLYLSYNLVSYTASGTKTGNVWTLCITFTDRYDFAPKAWTDTLSADSIVTAVNNYAVYAQSLEAIVPYNITVTVRTTFPA